MLSRIASAVCPEPGGLVIEIGPGTGNLTSHLLSRARQVVAIELDEALADRLRLRFAAHPNLTVVTGDVLQIELSQWGRAAIAGNLPYYITSPIVERVLCLGETLERAVLLIQKEVAERLTAAPGSRDFGFLTVRTAVFARREFLFSVPAAAFRPPPKVDSAVVRLIPDPYPIEDPHGFVEFLGHCFRQKRKTLRNNLVPVFGKERVDGCQEAGLRAEQLSLEGFAALYRRLRYTEGKRKD